MGLRLTLYSAGAATMLDIAKRLGTNFFCVRRCAACGNATRSISMPGWCCLTICMVSGPCWKAMMISLCAGGIK